MLGALGALIRKDERTLFNKHSDGLYVSAPKLSQEMEYEFTEDLGYEVQRKILDEWCNIFTGTPQADESWNELRVIFETSRLRILYTSEESHEWILYTDTELECLCGVYQKFNFEFGDGKFHDIVSMGTTQNIAWNVLNAASFDPLVLCNVGNILNLQRKINNKLEVIVPAEIWHIIMGFSVDCFQPISHMMEVDIVLRDVRRWTQNLYLSESLRRRDEFGDDQIRKFGQLFIEIGGRIDSEYIKYRKQFSLRKKFVRFMKYKFGQITNETSQKLKGLKSTEKEKEKEKDKAKTKNKHKKSGKKRHKKSDKSSKIKNSKKRRKKRKRNISPHLRSHTIDVGTIRIKEAPSPLAPPLIINKSADI